jgi:hypothetical protein
MNLLLLAPDIQAEVLALRFPPGREPVTERHLRQVLRSPVWAEQRAVWRRLRPAPIATVPWSLLIDSLCATSGLVRPQAQWYCRPTLWWSPPSEAVLPRRMVDAGTLGLR